MPEDAITLYPFLTREMLSQGPGTSFSLQVSVWSRGSQELRLRGITRTGRFSQSVRPAGTKAEELFTFPLPELPIWLTVDGPGIDFALDQAYVKVDFMVNGDRVHTLCSGYVNNVQTISFPNSIPRSQHEGRGLFALQTDTDPAANTEINVTVPADEIWKVHAMKFTLTTDSNAANRRAKITIQNGSTTFAHISAPAVQTASTTVIYQFGIGLDLQNDSDSLVQTIPLPDDILLFDGDDIKTVTLNRQVTDNWGIPILYVEKWLVPWTP